MAVIRIALPTLLVLTVAVALDDAPKPLNFGFRFRRPLSRRVSFDLRSIPFGFRFRQSLFDLSLTNYVRKHRTHLQDKYRYDYGDQP